jgi:hypothetical protein
VLFLLFPTFLQKTPTIPTFLSVGPNNLAQIFEKYIQQFFYVFIGDAVVL